MNTLVIIVISLSFVLIILAQIKKNYTDHDYGYRDECDNDNDCDSGNCVVDNDLQKRVCLDKDGTSVCHIETANLTTCNPADKLSCDKCASSVIDWSCQVVNKEKTEMVNGKEVTIPVSGSGTGWCLPDVKSGECNTGTGEPVLMKLGDGHYEWSCECLEPSMFDHNTNKDSNCVFNKACGAGNNDGVLYMPDDANTKCVKNDDCGESKICCLSDQNIYGDVCHKDGEADLEGDAICHDVWGKDNTTSPATGKCLCAAGKTYTGETTDNSSYSKRCESDICAPGGKTNAYNNDTGKIECICDKSTVPGESHYSCPSEIGNQSDFLKNKCRNNPQCIKDPCGPNGVVDDTNNFTCKCDAGYLLVSDTNQPNGVRCVKGCVNGGKCGPIGERSTSCTVQDNKEMCTCKCPWANGPSNSCEIIDDGLCPSDVCASHFKMSGGSPKLSKCWHNGLCKFSHNTAPGGLPSFLKKFTYDIYKCEKGWSPSTGDADSEDNDTYNLLFLLIPVIAALISVFVYYSMPRS